MKEYCIILMMQHSFDLLGYREWGVLAKLSICTEPCICDLREVRYVYPPGVVGFMLMAYKRAREGLCTEILVPESDDVLNYLERIDFFSKLPDCVELDQTISFLAQNRRNPSDSFSELKTPTESGFDQVKKVIWNYFEREVPEDVKSIYSAFEEVLHNIRDHSDPVCGGTAYCCIQVQVYKGAIELAFGDLGVGFLATLRRNPNLLHLQDEVSALQGALVEGYSRFAHKETHRGGGLRRASQIIVDRFRGKFMVLSRNGVARQSKIDEEFYCTPHTFPGTLVWMHIPCLS